MKARADIRRELRRRRAALAPALRAVAAAAIARHASLRRPLLVGLAFDCQHSGDFVPEAHDVPLDLLITESGLRDWRRGRGSTP